MPRSPSYGVVPAGPLLAGLVLAASACSADPAPEADAGQRGDAVGSEAPFTAPELDGPGSGAPEFRGRLAATLARAEREVIDEPCTGNLIERLCGSSARVELRPTGAPRPVEVVRASTAPDPGGLTWRVRLALEAPGGPLPRPAADEVLVLQAPRGLQVEVGPDAEVDADGVVLPGLTKRAAWGLVTRLENA